MKQILLTSAAAILPFTAIAAPNVVTDIAPIHGLVSRVMEGVGTPDLIVDQSASPHGFSMRVSQAQALEQADLVFWVGAALTPWLEEPLETIASNADVVGLLEAPGLTLLSYRESHNDHDDHEGHDAHEDHDADEDHDDHADHDDHDDHADHDDHDKHEDHDDHAEHEDHDDHADHKDHDDHDDHAGHDHGHDHGAGDKDPHAWLDPENAIVWLGLIAEELAHVDPENADAYAANAAAGADELRALDAELTELINGSSLPPYVVLHDGYQYFDTAYGLTFAGSVLDASGASQGPKHLVEMRAHIEEEGVSCLLVEPQLNASLVATVSENLDIKTETIDPLGADLELGPMFYSDLMRAAAQGAVSCLTP